MESESEKIVRCQAFVGSLRRRYQYQYIAIVDVAFSATAQVSDIKKSSSANKSGGSERGGRTTAGAFI